MKKIIHFMDVLTIGGIQTQLLSVLPYMDKENFEHIVYSMTDKLDMAGEFQAAGIRVKSLGLQEELKSKKWISIIKNVKIMLDAQRPDIVVTHQTWARIFTVLSLPWLGKKPRIIAMMQGEEYNEGLKYKLANFTASLFIDKFIACSEYFKNWIIKYYRIPAKKVTVMHNTVSLDKFRPDLADSQRARNELGLENNEIALVSIGTLGFRSDKGMKYCVDAMNILKRKYNNIKLFIVGEGRLRPALEKQIEGLGLKDTVTLLGYRRDIPYILGACDIFVSASVFEPFGIMFIEAMAMEKPVIGSPAGGIPEIIKDGLNGFFAKSRDAQDFARAIERLIADEELRLKMGKLAREDARNRFNSVDYARRLQDIYEE